MKDHNELKEGRNLRGSFKKPSHDRIRRMLTKKKLKKDGKKMDTRGD